MLAGSVQLILYNASTTHNGRARTFAYNILQQPNLTDDDYKNRAKRAHETISTVMFSPNAFV